MGTGAFKIVHLNKLPFCHFFLFIIIFHLTEHLGLWLHSIIQFYFSFSHLLISFLIFKMYLTYFFKVSSGWTLYKLHTESHIFFLNDKRNLLILLSLFLINSLTVKFTTISFAVLICYFLLFSFQFGGSTTNIFTS